jgi:hypothetical protein
MITTEKFLALTLAAILGGLSIAPAENSDKKPPGPPNEGNMRDKMREKFLGNLPPDIRQRFKAAREKALQDPKIQELRKGAERANGEFLKAMRDKMMEIDPGLGEFVRKKAMEDGKNFKDRREDGKGWMDKARGEMRPDGPPGMGGLTEEERQKLMDARQKAKSDPAVQAAEKKKDEAKTPEDRKTASEDYRQVMHDAMLKIDPSLKGIMEKLGAKPHSPKPPGTDGEGEMMSPQ